MRAREDVRESNLVMKHTHRLAVPVKGKNAKALLESAVAISPREMVHIKRIHLPPVILAVGETVILLTLPFHPH